MTRRGRQRWLAGGGAIVAPDPRAIQALAARPSARRGLLIGAALSCLLHVVLAAWLGVRGTRELSPLPSAIPVSLLDEPTLAAAVALPSPPAPPPTPARLVPPPPAPKPSAPPTRPRVASKPIPAPASQATLEPASAVAPAADTAHSLPAVSAAPPGHGTAVDPIAAYVASVSRRIEANKHYPSLAKSRGVEGTVVVTLWISPVGGLERLEVGDGAPPLLVSSTRDAVERASPFPPPPDGTPSIRVPIRYALR